MYPLLKNSGLSCHFFFGKLGGGGSLLISPVTYNLSYFESYTHGINSSNARTLSQQLGVYKCSGWDYICSVYIFTHVQAGVIPALYLYLHMYRLGLYLFCIYIYKCSDWDYTCSVSMFQAWQQLRRGRRRGSLLLPQASVKQSFILFNKVLYFSRCDNNSMQYCLVQLTGGNSVKKLWNLYTVISAQWRF